MKKRIVALGLAAVLMLMSVPTLAEGFMAGFLVEPVVNSMTGFVVGWEFDDANIEVTKGNLASWTGDWSVGAFWTPRQETFAYRAGGMIDWRWDNNGLKYKGFTVVVGAQKGWGPFMFYGDIRISSTGLVAPWLGVNLLFSKLAADAEPDEPLQLE